METHLMLKGSVEIPQAIGSIVMQNLLLRAGLEGDDLGDV
jgi:hypothetical protein